MFSAIEFNHISIQCHSSEDGSSYSFAFMALLLALGIVVFNKVQKSFMDTV